VVKRCQPLVTRKTSERGCDGQETPPSRVSSEGGGGGGRVSPPSLQMGVGGVRVSSEGGGGVRESPPSLE